MVVRSIATEEHVVALTFDDGPSRPWTELVLEALAELDVRATFFVQGAAVDDETSALVVRTAREGHEIGNHTHSHFSFDEVRDETVVRDELGRTHELLASLIGRPPDLVRPPYGRGTELVDAAASALGYRATVNWSIDPEDWDEPPAEEIVECVVEELHPGAIVLLHDGSPLRERARSRSVTTEALATLVPEIRSRGYRFATVGELLDGHRA